MLAQRLVIHNSELPDLTDLPPRLELESIASRICEVGKPVITKASDTHEGTSGRKRARKTKARSCGNGSSNPLFLLLMMKAFLPLAAILS
jgi:hypothetical protein